MLFLNKQDSRYRSAFARLPGGEEKDLLEPSNR